MKYYIDEFFCGEMSQEECEDIIDRYRKYIKSIFPQLPYAQSILTKINLHDAVIHSFILEKDVLSMTCVAYDQEKTSRLHFTYVGVERIDRERIRALCSNKKTEIIADELESLPNAMFKHSIRFPWIGYVEVEFKDLKIEIENASYEELFKNTLCEVRV